MIETITSGSGRRPLEKDLHIRHLVSGLPVPTDEVFGNRRVGMAVRLAEPP